MAVQKVDIDDIIQLSQCIGIFLTLLSKFVAKSGLIFGLQKLIRDPEFDLSND